MKALYYAAEGVMCVTAGFLILAFVPSLLLALVLATVVTGSLAFLFTYFDPFYDKE